MSDKSKVLYCGEMSYEVTPKAEKAIEGVMYWTHCEKLDSAELREAEKAFKKHEQTGEYCKYTQEEINQLRHEVEQEHLSIGDMMNAMEKEGVPNWVGNGAMEWARNHDLREHHMSDFFEKSAYAKKQEKKAPAHEKE